METFHLLHLASVWRPHLTGEAPSHGDASEETSERIPLTSRPVTPSISPGPSTQHLPPVDEDAHNITPVSTNTAPDEQDLRLPRPPRIRAASVQMIFADRKDQGFITPAQVDALEALAGRAVLETLVRFGIREEVSGFFSLLLLDGEWLMCDLTW